MKRIKGISQILVLIFSLSIIFTGMYAPDRDMDSCFSCSPASKTLSKVSSLDGKMIAAEEPMGELADEITAGRLPEVREALSFRTDSFKILFFTAVLPLISFIVWTVLVDLLKKGIADRMFLILFIHNSDGEKGDTAGILLA